MISVQELAMVEISALELKVLIQLSQIIHIRLGAEARHLKLKVLNRVLIEHPACQHQQDYITQER